MKRERLGKSGLEVSALALGTDLIGSKINRTTSFGIFDFYREKGGNFLDTANFYASWLPGFQGGESETTIGAWMKERRNRNEMVISSKLAFDYPDSKGGLSASKPKTNPAVKGRFVCSRTKTAVKIRSQSVPFCPVLRL